MAYKRNAAARQALMEHFLKFSSEDNTYEQCEVMDAIDRVWGSKRFGHRQDEPPSDTLILACFQDNQRPVAVRLRTARYLPVVPLQADFQAVLLLAVTNTPRSLKGEPNLLLTREAMAWLKGMGDADALTVLLTQTNGPSWRTEIITNACRAIETRLKDGVQTLPR